MNFHEARVDLICYILNQGPEYLKQIEKRNAYDKIIRNYHQSTPDGDQVYRNLKRGKEHLVHSKKALEIIDNEKNWAVAREKLWYEHAVPIKLIRLKLEALMSINREIKAKDVQDILDCTCLVVIEKGDKTNKEGDRIDCSKLGFKDKMPIDDWHLKGDKIFARFHHENVKIELEDNFQDKIL